MMNFRKISIVSLLVLTGCFGNNKDGGTKFTAEDPAKPFVEVSIEFPGPQQKWSGPQNFIVRVSTMQPGSAEITVAPPLDHSSLSGVRTPCIESASLSVEMAREQMLRLNSAMSLDESTFTGCLLPIHVRLVRIDGTVVEKKGCRSPVGWPRVAGDVANFLIDQLEKQESKKK